MPYIEPTRIPSKHQCEYCGTQMRHWSNDEDTPQTAWCDPCTDDYAAAEYHWDNQAELGIEKLRDAKAQQS